MPLPQAPLTTAARHPAGAGARSRLRTCLLLITVLLAAVWCAAFTLAAARQTQRGVGVRVRGADGQTREIPLYEGSYALVIGNGKYADGWDELTGVSGDVVAVRAILERHGFKVEVAENLDSRQFNERVRQFIDDYGYQRDNRLLLYFAGHGHTLTSAGDGRELGYVVTTDAPYPTRDELGFRRKAVSMETIHAYAKQIQAKHALFLFDSCFSGKLLSRSAVQLTPYIQENVAYAVRQFITAGAANQSVPDESIFRRALVRGLEGEADRNNDQYVTGTELAEYLKERVTNYTERRQTPQYGKINDIYLDRGDFVFVTPPAAAPNVSTRTPSPGTPGPFLGTYRRWLDSLKNGAQKKVLREADAELARNPNNLLALRVRSSAYYYRDDNEKGRKDAEAVARSLVNARSAEEYEARCYVNWRLDKNAEAVRDCTTAINLDPRFTWAYHYRANAYSDLGEYDRALADYGKAIELDPRHNWAYNNRGTTYKDKGDNDRALADFNKAIELDPQYKWTYNSRGNLYHDIRRDYDRALADYSKAVELDPNYASAYKGLGFAYFNKKEYDRALREFTRAIELDPKLVTAYYGRALCHARQKEYDRALADYNKAIELDPDYAAAYNGRGNVYSSKGDDDRALADYSKAIELDPKHHWAYNNRGIIYYDRKDYDRALADFNKAIKLDPRPDSVYNNRGLVYYDRKEYDRALADYSKAIELDPNYVVAYQNRANVYEAKGDMARAAADRQKAAELEK